MKCLWVFVISLLPLIILNALNYWQIKHVEPSWTPWMWFTIKWAPAFLVAQISIYWVWSHGYHRFCGGQIWIVWLLWNAAMVFVAMIMAKVFFGQWPEKGALVGFILYCIGAVIASVWR